MMCTAGCVWTDDIQRTKSNFEACEACEGGGQRLNTLVEKVHVRHTYTLHWSLFRNRPSRYCRCRRCPVCDANKAAFGRHSALGIRRSRVLKYCTFMFATALKHSSRTYSLVCILRSSHYVPSYF